MICSGRPAMVEANRVDKVNCDNRTSRRNATVQIFPNNQTVIPNLILTFSRNQVSE